MIGAAVSLLGRVVGEEPVFYAYWPDRETGMYHFAFGLDRPLLALFALAQAVLIPTAVILLVTEYIGLALIPATLSVAALGVLFLRERASGWYRVDANGRSVEYFSDHMPTAIEDKKGVGRRKFLEEAAGEW